MPLRKSEVAPLNAISDKLRALRVSGRQPSVVLLQEAFTAEAKKIGKAAGYRYVADGPDIADRNSLPVTFRSTELDRENHWWAGEGQGKYLDSGLQILSDYPIVRVRRLPFPDKACAGFDCLSNKGVVLISVKVPGQAVPVDVVTTHLNSRGSAGVSKGRSLIAYRRQVESLFAFLAANRDAERPLIFAGDLNIGKAQQRRAAYFAEMRVFSADQPLRDAVARVALSGPDALSTDAREAQARAKDWQFWADGTRLRLEPVAVRVPFGHEPDGLMLSDHIGFVTEYRLVAASGRSLPS